MTCDVIVLAAGLGTRFGDKKQFYLVGGVPILVKTLTRIYESACFRNCIVVVPPDDVLPTTVLLAEMFPRVEVIAGGASRFLSSRAAVRWVYAQPVPPEAVIIHDGVRPFIMASALDDLYATLQAGPWAGAVFYLPIYDSIIHFETNKEIAHTYLERSNVVRVQTPHIYRVPVLAMALEAEADDSIRENAEIFFSAGNSLAFLEGDSGNIKVTTQADLRYFHEH